MNPPIAYFQAAATVIPALLIAVAVGMKRGHVLAEQKGEARQYQNLNIVLILSFMIGAGEVNALLAIANNGGTAVQGYWAYQGIILALGQVVYELVEPVNRTVESKAMRVMTRVYTLALSMTALIYGQITFFGPIIDTAALGESWYRLLVEVVRMWADSPTWVI